MKIGLFGINMGACVEPRALAAVARAAEQAGFDSLWTGEHVVLPDPQVAPSPLPADFPILDPAVALTWAAAATESILLATGIIILPQRNPLVLAKELASVDVVSGGRLVFGVGIGYLEPEFAALGIPFENKGARTIEYLRAIESIWTDDAPAFDGRFVSFSGIQARPRPARSPRPPIVFGGATPHAYRRAALYADGWYGFALDVEGAADCVTQLREIEEASERPAHLGRLEVTVSPPFGAEIDAPAARRYRDAGVDRLALLHLAGSVEEILRSIASAGERLVGKV